MTKPRRHRAAVSPVPKGRGRPGEWAIPVSGIALLLMIGILAAWAHYGTSTARPDAPRAGATSASDDVTAPATPQMRVQLRAWLAQSQPSLDALLAARRDIASAAASNDIAGTGATCQTAQGAVAGVEHVLPSPEPSLNATPQRAVGAYRLGLGRCIEGARTNGGNDIAQAATYLSEAGTDLQAAVGALERDVPGFQSQDGNIMTV